LLTRLAKTDLLEKNILHSEVAPSLQATQQALMHSKIRQNLNKKLDTRPSQDELRARNILKEDSVSSDGHNIKLQLEDNLSRKLSQRPTLATLKEKHIIQVLEVETEE